MNYRGMMRGAGEAISQVGQIGLQEALVKAKEDRLAKLQREAEARSETRDLAKEERGEKRSVAAEVRAKTADAEGDARKHANRLAEMDRGAALDKDKAKFEKDLQGGSPKHKVITTDGSLTEPGGVYIYNETDPTDIRRLDEATGTTHPLSASGTPAASAIPQEIDAVARARAKARVEAMAGWMSGDEKDFADVGGDRKAAEGKFYREELSKALTEDGQDPARYGLPPAGKGVLSMADEAGKSQGPTFAPKNTGAPVPGDIGNTGAQVAAPSSAGAGGIAPADAQALVAEFQKRGWPDGRPVRRRNGEVWTVVNGVPKKLE